METFAPIGWLIARMPAVGLLEACKFRNLIRAFLISHSWVLVLFVASQSRTTYALSPDGKALLKFKGGIKASNDALANWREDDQDPCNWLGVTCDPVTRRVINLSLPFRKLSGHISPSLGELGELRKLRLHHNSLFGSIPPHLGNCSRLKALYLEVNYLSGFIPSELGNLSQLMILDLSSNSLVGRIPDSFGNLQKLNLLNVSTNYLTGEIPEDGVLSKFSGKSFAGNLQLCGQQVGVLCMSPLEGNPLLKGIRTKSGHFSAKLLVTALGTVGVSFLIALLCFWGCFLYKHINKNTKPNQIDETIERNDDPRMVFFHGDLPYSSKEISKRVELLVQSSIIGCGGFGTVYKLVMEDGSVFALKKIENSSLRSDRSFERELEILGSIKHRSLVNLRGYCKTPSSRLLIYDYLCGGTLDEALHGSSQEAGLTWTARIKIALGTARGLAYLHHDCWPPIIHRDIKSSNILLGENLEPQVSDFGLAKLVQEGDSHLSTVVAGTVGYLAPEYLLNGKATEKSDVYSYGVVLLELISGKRPTDPALIARGLNIVGWVNTLLEERRLKEVMDPTCECRSAESMEAVLSVAMMCIHSIPHVRPTMHSVVKMLEIEAEPHQCSSLSDLDEP